MRMILIFALLLFAGGPPSKGTKRDMRLSRNNPQAGKKTVKPIVKPAKKG